MPTPSQTVGALWGYDIFIGLLRPTAQLLALLTLCCIVIGQRQPRSHASHWSAETFLTGHFFVAPVPRRANLCLHVLLQLHLRHVFLHWASHLASLPAPIGTVGYGTCLLVVMAHAGSTRAKATVKTLVDNLFMMFRFCEVSVRQGWIVG